MTSLFSEHCHLLLTGYLVTITALLFIVAYTFRNKWTKKSRTRTLAVNLSVSLFSVFYILLALEGIFAYALIESDGFGFTMSSKRWSKKYWRPINSYGYRDYEPEWRDNILFVVGDSFVAGHGIKDIDNRFANLLSNKLGEQWTVTILAKPGWSLKNYINALTSHDKTPNVIIVSYFINDIESAASSVGIRMPPLKKRPNKLTRLFIDRFYLLNWAYWRVYRGHLGQDSYRNYHKRSYNNDDVWSVHIEELDALVNYAKSNNARIAFVIWPYLRGVSESKEITSKVSGYLAEKGVILLDLSRRFEKREPNELIVNAMDPHPNEIVHAEVSDLLHQALAPWD